LGDGIQEPGLVVYDEELDDVFHDDLLAED
jgi:hypothetical protein